MHQAQYYDGIKLLETFSRYKTRVGISHLRPVVPVSKDPRAWWHYAVLAGLQQQMRYLSLPPPFGLPFTSRYFVELFFLFYPTCLLKHVCFESWPFDFPFSVCVLCNFSWNKIAICSIELVWFLSLKSNNEYTLVFWSYWFSWDRIKHLCQLRRRYVHIYANSLQHVPGENISEIRQIEKALDSKVILLWRYAPWYIFLLLVMSMLCVYCSFLISH